MYSSDQLTTNKIAATFTGISSDLEDIIDRQKDRLEEIRQHEEDIKEYLLREYPNSIRKREQAQKEWFKAITWRKKFHLQHRIEENEKILDQMKVFENIPEETDLPDASEVKDRPIENFLDFNKQNKRPCIFCSDTSGDMHYYEEDNRVYCFSCQKGGDVIDVIQEVRGCTFKEALKFLG